VRHTSNGDIVHKNIQKQWVKTGLHAGMWLGNNQGNLHLHGFTTSENAAKVLERSNFFDPHCNCVTAVIFKSSKT